MGNITEKSVHEAFEHAFGFAPHGIVKAPGRVNLIGEHTDYNGGYVLPAAIDYFTYIAFFGNESRELKVVAQDFNKESTVVDLTSPMVFDEAASWPNYVRGVIQQLLQENIPLKGGYLLITGDVPAGAGLSSSASLEMSLIRALTEMCSVTIDPTIAALLGQAAENQFVGCNCGIMDQLISARGEESSALLIDCRELSVKAVSIPSEWELLIVHSGVKRGLVDSEYNQRRQQCENAAAHFGVASLRDVTLPELLSARDALDELSFRRAHHVLTENARTLLAAEALAAGDMNSLAKVMAESHVSMRDDFSITTSEIDALVSILQAAAAGKGGARMTGGGFGGCVVAIAPQSLIATLETAVLKEYESKTGCTPRLIRARATAGAFTS